MSDITPSATVGPFFAYMLTPKGRYPVPDAFSADLVGAAAIEGERITISGRVTDGEGAPVPDAMVEIWQADAHGSFAHARGRGGNTGFLGFGRADTDADGVFAFKTIKPGAGAGAAPHIDVAVFARGLLNHLVTRIYFADEPANAHDPGLAHVPEARRATLLAQSMSRGAYRFDIRLQGENETVFFRT